MPIKHLQDMLYMEDTETRYDSYYSGPRLGLRDYQGYETRLRITFAFNSIKMLAGHIDLMVLGPGAKWERLGEVNPKADVESLTRSALWNEFYAKTLSGIADLNERLKAKNESNSGRRHELIKAPSLEEVQEKEQDRFLHESTEAISRAFTADVDRLLKIAKIIE